MWFKGLVSAAAVAIIVGVGVFLWDRHQAEAAIKQAECDARLADVKRLRSGQPSERGSDLLLALTLASSCGYVATADDRKAAGLD